MKNKEKTNNTLKKDFRRNLTIFNKFAKYYDKIYFDKNYKKECDFIFSNFKKCSNKPVKSILDLGCGTGGHCIVFAKKGLSVTGIDKSDLAIQNAKEKAESLKLRINFEKEDMTKFSLNKKFDICVSLFCSFCYLNSMTEIINNLKCVNRHLKTGGLFIFDFWNGDAVISEKPTTRVKIIEDSENRILRIATPKLDQPNQTCAIEYHCLIIKNNKIIDEFKEVHNLRYHFRDELRNRLEEAGFEVLDFIPIEGKNKQSLKNSYSNEWYLYAITRKK